MNDLQQKVKEELSKLTRLEKVNMLSLLFTKSFSDEYKTIIDLLDSYRKEIYNSHRNRGFLNAAQASYIALFDLLLDDEFTFQKTVRVYENEKASKLTLFRELFKDIEMADLFKTKKRNEGIYFSQSEIVSKKRFDAVLKIKVIEK